MKIKKIFTTVLIVALLFAFATSAFAETITDTFSAGSSTWVRQGVSRDNSAFSLSGVWIRTWYSATSLTIRPYKTDGTTKLSNAKTYRSGAISGGQTYWSNPPSIIWIRGNSDTGDKVDVYGSWTF